MLERDPTLSAYVRLVNGESSDEELQWLASRAGGPGFRLAHTRLAAVRGARVAHLHAARSKTRHLPTWLRLSMLEAEAHRAEREDGAARVIYQRVWDRLQPQHELTPTRHTRIRYRALRGLYAVARVATDVPPLQAQARHAVDLSRMRRWRDLDGLILLWQARGWTGSPPKRPLRWLGRPRRRRKGDQFLVGEISGPAGEAVNRELVNELECTYPLQSGCTNSGASCVREQARALLANGAAQPPWLVLLTGGEAAWFRLLFDIRHERWTEALREGRGLAATAHPRRAPHNHDLSDISLTCGGAFWGRRAAEHLKVSTEVLLRTLRSDCAFGYYDLLDRGVSGERVLPHRYPLFRDSPSTLAGWYVVQSDDEHVALEILREDMQMRDPVAFDHEWVGERMSPGHAVALQWEFPLGKLSKSPTRTETESFEGARRWTTQFRAAGRAVAQHWVWLLAVARQESRFNARVCSGSGACGMLQLKPAAAEFVATKYKIPYEGTSDLNDPVKNIRLGATLLAHLRTRLEAGSLKALMAYNAGPGSVRRSQAAALDDHLFLEAYEDRRAAAYVRGIVVRYGRYAAEFGGGDLHALSKKATSKPERHKAKE